MTIWRASARGTRWRGRRCAEFDFVDLRDGKRWRLKPDEGPLPLWVTREARRVPGTAMGEYLRYLPLLWAGRKTRIGEVVKERGALWERLMRPFLLAVLNTEPEDSSAALAGAVLRETLAKGGRSLSPAHCPSHLGGGLRRSRAGISGKQGRAGAPGHAAARPDLDRPPCRWRWKRARPSVPVDGRDAVVLAVPPWVAGELVPDLTVPDDFRAIVNAHFRMAPPAGSPAMLGVIGGTAEWIFAFPDRISRHRVRRRRHRRQGPGRAGAPDLGRCGQGAGHHAPTCPPGRSSRKSAPPSPPPRPRTPGGPTAKTRWRNLFLAGDWTQTGLPATIEGALRSGEKAAALAARHLSL